MWWWRKKKGKMVVVVLAVFVVVGGNRAEGLGSQALCYICFTPISNCFPLFHEENSTLLLVFTVTPSKTKAKTVQ